MLYFGVDVFAEVMLYCGSFAVFQRVVFGVKEEEVNSLAVG